MTDRPMSDASDESEAPRSLAWRSDSGSGSGSGSGVKIMGNGLWVMGNE